MVGDLTQATGSFLSVRGKISSSWKRTGLQLSLNVVIPPNTSATVYVPARDLASIRESDMPSDRAPGVKFLRAQGNFCVFEVGSGTYRFASAMAPVH